MPNKDPHNLPDFMSDQVRAHQSPALPGILQGSQFDRGGSLFFPTLNYHPQTGPRMGGDNDSQVDYSNYFGGGNWSAADPNDNNWLRSFAFGGRPQDRLFQNPDGTFRMSYELGDQLRGATGLNNGRIFANYALNNGQLTPTGKYDFGESTEESGFNDIKPALKILAAAATGAGLQGLYGAPAVPSVPGAGAAELATVGSAPGFSLPGGIGSITSAIGTAGRALGQLGGQGQGGSTGARQPGLLDLIAGLYGQSAQRGYSRDLMGLVNQMQNQSAPLIQALQSSYTNPQSFLDSPEMQARLGIESNRLTRQDAAKGRLSNDVDRTRLLQDYGMNALNDYRKGLASSIGSVYQPNTIASLFGAASRADNSQWADLIGAAGRAGGISQGIGGVVRDIGNVINTGEDLWDTISGWFE